MMRKEKTMNNYVIYTDSACDISKSTLEEWGVRSVDLSFRFVDEDATYRDNEMPIKDFYDQLRDGRVAKTSAVNPDEFVSAFEKELKVGNDVLYIGFSSALSTTFNSARIAKEILSLSYSERKILTVDSFCASAGLGLLLNLAAKKANGGATIDEVAGFVESARLNVCHWFTVEDLVYLKRGGRISSAKAFVGNMLGIKPVLHVDNGGHLVNVTKARGRRLALSMLLDKYIEARKDKSSSDTVYISHADCNDDAELLSAMIKEKTGAEVSIITNVGAVIGAHAGPGTLALFFIGENR